MKDLNKMSIGLDELTVLQDDLRHFSQMGEMIDFVRNGGFWTQEALNEFAIKTGISRVCPLMEIAYFAEDERLMIHDGHHRAVATSFGGRDFLRSSEFTIKEWKYENYRNVNFANKWVTPLDPKKEIRFPDIGDFKKIALNILLTSEEEALRFILENKCLYARTRTVSSLAELRDRYLLRSEEHGHCESKSDYCLT